MIVDTDVLIWSFRGHEHAAEWLDGLGGFSISAVSYMELLQGARNRTEMQLIRRTLRFWKAHIEPIDPAISNRAMFLVEEYALSHGLALADALIASTALSAGMVLCTANDKHYRFIEDLELKIFRP